MSSRKTSKKLREELTDLLPDAATVSLDMTPGGDFHFSIYFDRLNYDGDIVVTGTNQGWRKSKWSKEFVSLEEALQVAMKRRAREARAIQRTIRRIKDKTVFENIEGVLYL